MLKRLFVFVLIVLGFTGKTQCPLVYNYLGTPTLQPLLLSCSGLTFTQNLTANASFGSYTINWGDASPNTTGSSYTVNTPISHSYPATVNVYSITLTIPSLACVLVSTLVVEKPVNASIQIPTLGLTTACAPKTLTFTNSSTDVSPTTTFTWNFGGGSAPFVTTFTNANQNVTHQYNKGDVACQTQITLQAQNYCSFGNPTIANFNPINIYDLDNAAITPNKIITCLPDNSFTFSNSSQRNCLPEGNTFQRQEKWNFGNYWGFGHDSIIGWRPWPPSTPITIAYPTVGSYNVFLSDSNLCGVSTTSMTVFVSTAPVASLIVPSGISCQNTAVTFTNASSPGYAYRWDFGAGSGFQSLGSGNKTFTYTAPGTYTVRLRALINGASTACSDTAFGVINILPTPTASFVLTPTVGCNALTNVVYTDFSTPGVSYSWNFGNGVTSTLSSPPSQNYTTTGLFTPTLTVVTNSGCTNSFTGSVLVRPNPIPAFTQFTNCVSLPITFTNNSTPGTGPNAITGYTWDFGDASPISTSSAPVKTYSLANTYTVKLIATTAFCSDSIKQTVSLNLKPVPIFAVSPTVACPPFTPSVVNTSSFALNYHWRFGTSPSATSSAANPVYTYTNATQATQNYTITLIASTGAGCSDSLKKTVSVRPKPVANFTANSLTGCAPLATTFSNTSIGYANALWDFGDAVTALTASPQVTHSFSNTTLFTQTVSTKVIVTNGFGCSDSIKQVVTIYPEALPVFTPMPAFGCSPLVVNFPSVPGIVTYTWNHGDGSPTFTTLNTHNWTYTNSSLTDVVFTVSMTALTSNGCIGGNTQTLSVFARPVANFSFNPGSGCSPAIVNFTNSSQLNAVNNWTLGNGLTSSQASPIGVYTNQPGGAQITYSVKLLVETHNACKDSLTRNFVMFSLPKANFTADTPACSPKTITFTNTTQGAVNYKWEFGDGAVSTASNPAHVYINSTAFDIFYTIKLLATTTETCKDSTTFQLLVHPKPSYEITAAPNKACSPLKVFFQKIPGVKNYEWKYDNISFGNAGDINNTFENKSTAIKNFTVELIASDAFGCKDTASKVIEVYPVPEAEYDIFPLTVYVPNQSTTFTNRSTGANTYSYNFGDGSSSNERSPSHIYASEGEYLTSLTVANTFGCKDSYTVPEKVIAINETTVIVPNAFTPSSAGPKGGFYDPKDLSNDVFYPGIKGTAKYTFSVYSRWGELLFETKDTNEGWDGYYKGKLCTQDVYIWKINATFNDGRTYNKTGDLLLLR